MKRAVVCIPADLLASALLLPKGVEIVEVHRLTPISEFGMPRNSFTLILEGDGLPEKAEVGDCGGPAVPMNPQYANVTTPKFVGWEI